MLRIIGASAERGPQTFAASAQETKNQYFPCVALFRYYCWKIFLKSWELKTITLWGLKSVGYV